MVRIGPIGDWHVDRSIPSGYVLGTPYQAIQGCIRWKRKAQSFRLQTQGTLMQVESHRQIPDPDRSNGEY